MRTGPNTPEGIAKVTQNLPKKLPPEWGISPKGLQAIKTAVAMSNTKHGMVAAIPIICKGSECPYVATCTLEPLDLMVPGERCPLEIASIVQRFDAYMESLDIRPDNVVDMSLIKNLVDLEIQICRADKKVAINGDFIEEVIAAISTQGVPYYKPELSKAAEFKLKLLNEHARVLNLLHATRKDKAASKINMTIDASNYAASLLKRKKELEDRGEYIDVGIDD
jgi:hypothetical protein